MGFRVSARRPGGRAAWGVGVAVFVLVQGPSLARAHISLERGGTHRSRYGDGEQKAAPCGREGGTRGTQVYTYEPGQTIDVSLVEFVSHPGYFRIAFDADGDDDFKDPQSIKPVDPNRRCPSGPGDRCGVSDFYNNGAVLPGLDNLNPHLQSFFSTPKYTWKVKLPDVECTNCTLQVIQVMEDDLFHGPYDPTPGVGVADVYHQCIDLVLKRGGTSSAPASPGAPPSMPTVSVGAGGDLGAPFQPSGTALPPTTPPKENAGAATLPAESDDDEGSASTAPPAGTSEKGCAVVGVSGAAPFGFGFGALGVAMGLLGGRILRRRPHS